MGNRNIDKADEGLGGFHNVREGDTRITVPIPSAFLITDDGYLLGYPFRMVLAPGYEIALLDEKEEDRLRDGPYKIFAGFRLEIFGEASSDGLDFEDDQEHARLEEIITNALSLLSLCVRGYFSAPYAVVDRYDGNVWRRNEYIKTQAASYDLQACQRPSGNAHRRPRELPTCGQQNCPRAATISAHPLVVSGRDHQGLQHQLKAITPAPETAWLNLIDSPLVWTR